MCHWASNGFGLCWTLGSLHASMHREQQQHKSSLKKWGGKCCEDKEIPLLTKSGSWFGQTQTEWLTRWSKTDFCRSAFLFGAHCGWARIGGYIIWRIEMHERVTCTTDSHNFELFCITSSEKRNSMIGNFVWSCTWKNNRCQQYLGKTEPYSPIHKWKLWFAYITFLQ